MTINLHFEINPADENGAHAVRLTTAADWSAILTVVGDVRQTTPTDEELSLLLNSSELRELVAAANHILGRADDEDRAILLALQDGTP